MFVLIHSPLVGSYTWALVAAELQRRGAQYLRALLTAPNARRNAAQLAAAVAGATPRAFQRFLSDAPWDHRPIIDGLPAMLGPLLQLDQGMWVLEDIAFVKQGEHSVGVARQAVACMACR